MNNTDVLISLWEILQPEPGEDLLEAAKRIKHAYPYEPTHATEKGIPVTYRQAEGDQPTVSPSSDPAPDHASQAQRPVVDTWIEVWLGNQKYAQIANTQRNLALLMNIEATGFPPVFVTFLHPYGPSVTIRADTISGYFVSSPETRRSFRSPDVVASEEMSAQVAEEDEDEDDEGDEWKKGYVPAD